GQAGAHFAGLGGSGLGGAQAAIRLGPLMFGAGERVRGFRPARLGDRQLVEQGGAAGLQGLRRSLGLGEFGLGLGPRGGERVQPLAGRLRAAAPVLAVAGQEFETPCTAVAVTDLHVEGGAGGGGGLAGGTGGGPRGGQALGQVRFVGVRDCSRLSRRQRLFKLRQLGFEAADDVVQRGGVSFLAGRLAVEAFQRDPRGGGALLGGGGFAPGPAQGLLDRDQAGGGVGQGL